MYDEEDLKILNEYGRIGAGTLQRRHKISYDKAIKTLKKIVEDHINVFFLNEHQVYIHDPDYKEKKKLKIYKGWKDISQP